jgi:hypothetical protein
VSVCVRVSVSVCVTSEEDSAMKYRQHMRWVNKLHKLKDARTGSSLTDVHQGTVTCKRIIIV